MPMLSFFMSAPPVRVAHRNHDAEHVLPGLGVEHDGVGEHAAIPADMFDGARGFAIRAAQPGARVADDIEFAVGVVGRAVAAGLVVRARAFDGAIVLRDVEIDHPGAQSGGHFGVGFGQPISLAPLEIVGQEAIFGSVVAHGEEHGMRHVGLESDGLGAVHHFEQLHVTAPAMHACPADLAFGGEICWAGMHSWRSNVQLLEMVDRPQTVGFQADMAHTMLFTMGYNAPEDRLLPDDFEWSQTGRLAEAYAKMAAALRPWTIDFHVAQNDGTVKGAGSHDKTGRHCLPNDPNGKLDIVRDSGAWLRGATGEPTRAVRHICWDGCMFPNSVMLDPKTWEDVLRVMIAVRNAHGWN